MSVDTKSGLRIKPIYEQLISVALSDDNQNIRFPNRDAKFLREGFELSQLDGFGWEAMQRQQENATNEQYKQALIKQIAVSSGIDASDLRSETDNILRQERIHSMFNTPSSSGSNHSFQSSSPIVDVAREDNANMVQDGRRELALAQKEAAKQKSIANAEKAKNMFAELNNRTSSRAWSSVASSSGLQEIPEQLDDGQMVMANSQAFQQTAEQASMTVAKAVSQIKKRMVTKQRPPNMFANDETKTKPQLIVMINTLLVGKTQQTKPLSANGESIPFAKWSKQHLLDELGLLRTSHRTSDE